VPPHVAHRDRHLPSASSTTITTITTTITITTTGKRNAMST
jgi:hypothetical protein